MNTKGIRKPIKRDSLRAEFFSDRGQTLETPVISPDRKKTDNSPYKTFYRKYTDLENYIDSFGSRDLVYYFREIAQEQGIKYVIANIKKDMAIMKRLKENYSNREICGMIEFLFESEQDYLIKNKLSPNVLVSGWINTIYADMQLWVEDKYTPHHKEQQSKRKKSQHEWSSDVASNDTIIGAKL